MAGPLGIVEASFVWNSAVIVDWLVGNTLMALLIGLVALAVDRIGKRPAIAHLLWLLAMIKLVAPPIAKIPITWNPSLLNWMSARSIADTADAHRMGALARSIGSLDVVDVDTTGALSMELIAVWSVGSFMMSIWILLASRRVHRLIERRGRFDITATRQISSLCGDEGNPPPVWLVDAIVSPMLVSPIFRRFGGEVRIVFPKALWSRLDDNARAVLLIHELEHWRRQDWIVRFIEVTTMTVLWWHPLFWIAKLQIEDCEERCCDLAACTRSKFSPRIYAEAILRTLDFLCEPMERNRSELEPRPIASGVGSLPKLQHRLRQIMKPTCSQHIGRSGMLVVVGMLAFVPIYPAFQFQRPIAIAPSDDVAPLGIPEVLSAGSKLDPAPIRRAEDTSRNKPIE